MQQLEVIQISRKAFRYNGSDTDYRVVGKVHTNILGLIPVLFVCFV